LRRRFIVVSFQVHLGQKRPKSMKLPCLATSSWIVAKFALFPAIAICPDT
jgi:hypothetical protein